MTQQFPLFGSSLASLKLPTGYANQDSSALLRLEGKTIVIRVLEEDPVPSTISVDTSLDGEHPIECREEYIQKAYHDFSLEDVSDRKMLLLSLILDNS
ncbi:hypothetical protein NC652_018660 [Populus alba x Populus x berolinensis]|nr:hypothetical protein NC652_018660 [Populus alba x Populus x berolinensis]